MYVAAVAGTALAKPNVKASELQREIEHVTSELTLRAPYLRKGNDRTKEIQKEVEFMVSRVNSLHDEELTSEFAKEIDGIEKALLTKTDDKGLAMEISGVRASLCAQNGFQNHEFAECEDFMRQSCAPADTDDSDYADNAPLENFCVMFFREEAAAGAAHGAGAPAPGPAGAPAPGPVPMGQLFGGKHMRKLPDQGFDGKLVKHEDLDTMNEDWQHEFGPKSGHRKFEEICGDFPNNEWCRIHGYHGRAASKKTKTVIEHVIDSVPDPSTVVDPSDKKSGASQLQFSFAAVFAIFLAYTV